MKDLRYVMSQDDLVLAPVHLPYRTRLPVMESIRKLQGDFPDHGVRQDDLLVLVQGGEPRPGLGVYGVSLHKPTPQAEFFRLFLRPIPENESGLEESLRREFADLMAAIGKDIGPDLAAGFVYEVRFLGRLVQIRRDAGATDRR